MLFVVTHFRLGHLGLTFHCPIPSPAATVVHLANDQYCANVHRRHYHCSADGVRRSLTIRRPAAVLVNLVKRWRKIHATSLDWDETSVDCSTWPWPDDVVTYPILRTVRSTTDDNGLLPDTMSYKANLIRACSGTLMVKSKTSLFVYTSLILFKF